MNTRKAFLPIVLVFIIVNGIILTGKSFLDRMGFDRDMLIMANLLFFVITIGSFLIQEKGVRAANPNAFVRSVYGSLILKVFICMIAAFIYGFLNKGQINKPALFTSLGLYILYTVVEVIVLMKSSRKKKNA